MKDKKLWINIGISAGCYLIWLFVTFALLSVDALADYSLLLSAPLLIAGSAYMTYRSDKIIIYPLTASVMHVIMCIIAVISFNTDLESAVNSTSTGIEALIDIFIVLGSVVVYAAILIIGVISLIAIFVISLITGVITRRIIKKSST